jgi:hypothetical protein
MDLGLMAVVALLCLGLGAALVASAALRPQAPSERGVAPVLDVPSNPPAQTAAPLLQLPAEPPSQNAQPSAAPSPVPAGAPEQPQGGSGVTQPGSGAPTGPAGADPRQKFDEPNDPPIQGVKPIYIGEGK